MEKKNFISRNKLSMEELCKYYRDLREFNVVNNEPVKGVEFRKKVHPLITFLIKMRRLMLHQTLTTYINGREMLDPINDIKTWVKNDQGPVIFAITHTGKFDIELANEAIQLPYYLLSDDEEYMHRTVDGHITQLNGVIYIDNDYQSDQHVAYDTIKKTINAGANIMWFPERIWNLSPNQLILPCKFGIVSAAVETNARIVPVAIDQVDNAFHINFGEIIYPEYFKSNDEELSKDDKIKGINYLRDVLATLKYQLFELNPIVDRDAIDNDYYDKFVEQKISEWPFITKEDIDNMVFKPKNIVTNEEAFEHLDDIQYNTNTAFLLNKRLKK